MQEFFPLVAGAIIGALVSAICSLRWRSLALVALCVLAGAAASLVSGELEEGWQYLLFDIPQVFVAAALVAVAIGVWQRRAAR